MSTIYLPSRNLPEGYGICDQEEEENKFENPCSICGKSLDYEGDINNMCNCDEKTKVANL